MKKLLIVVFAGMLFVGAQASVKELNERLKGSGYRPIPSIVFDEPEEKRETAPMWQRQRRTLTKQEKKQRFEESFKELSERLKKSGYAPIGRIALEPEEVNPELQRELEQRRARASVPQTEEERRLEQILRQSLDF